MLKRFILSTAISLGAVSLTVLSADSFAQVPSVITKALKTYETPHYIMHTDISDEEAREADLRMTRMFEEYQRRTAAFTGQVNGKFPFFLFKNKEDYYTAGAPPESAGVFIRDSHGSRLMAIAGEKVNAETWHIVQHEGFHQFIINSVKGDIPIWANEGLAEYFGEAVFTGDGFVSGLIPPKRLDEIKIMILQKRFKPFAQMMNMSHEEWGSHLDYANYNQAWAMIHFLAQGENGRYQAAFGQFMSNLNHGVPSTKAWIQVFGDDTVSFENRFEKWWMGLPKNPTRDGYLKACASTLTSFLARATAQHQTFTDAEDYLANVKLPDLHSSRDMWLPPSLFEECRDATKKVGQWSLVQSKGMMPKLVCIDSGKKYTGVFTLMNNKVSRVSVDVTDAPGVTLPNK